MEGFPNFSIAVFFPVRYLAIHRRIHTCLKLAIACLQPASISVPDNPSSYACGLPTSAALSSRPSPEIRPMGPAAAARLVGSQPAETASQKTLFFIGPPQVGSL